MLSDDLLDNARRLALGDGARPPSQADLRRAASGVYYAVFHAICQSNADTLVGDDSQNRDLAAWRQTYRALEHGYAGRRCRQIQSNPRFSQPIRNLARHFPTIQRLRHQADYDPVRTLTLTEILSVVEQASGIIATFLAAPLHERRAFAVYILMRERQD